MAEYLRVARLYLVFLAITAVGRFLLGVAHKPYETHHHFFSIVILTSISCLYYGAFSRRWLGYRISQAVGLGATIGLSSQVVIFLATLLSYALGIDTYFTHPRALNEPDLTSAVPMFRALGIRTFGLVVNTILSSIVAALGWALGAVLPEKGQA